MKVALVHDWLIHMRGGEKVLEAFAEIFPDATVYTLFYDHSQLSPPLQKMKIRASFLQQIPGIRLFYRWLLPFLPHVIESLPIEEADLVLSSSHCVAKGIRIPVNALHICYCHTPMRYLWGFEKDYFNHFPFLIKPFLDSLLKWLREWDRKSCASVHQFISNSENVRRRIQKFYNRDAEVIFPPFDSRLFYPGENQKIGDSSAEYYLVVSAFVPYKRVDLVIEAFNRLDRKLLIVGSGPLEKTYRRLRTSKQISFLGSLPAADLRRLYVGAKALIFPTEEDFGIVPLEAQACATPVIAYGKGGALESVKHGVFFETQSPESLLEAVARFEGMKIDRSEIPDSVKLFDKEHFKTRIRNFIEKELSQKQNHAPV